MILGPNDNQVKNSKSDAVDGDFGGSRKVTTKKQRKTQDYKKPTESAMDMEKNPVDEVVKDIDEMTDSKERKREFSKLAELSDPADHNKERFHEIDGNNKPLEDNSATIIPDGSYTGSKIKNHFGSGQYNNNPNRGYEGEIR